MFGKISRYRKLDDEVIVRSDGRAVAGKALRLLPPTGAGFEHIVADVDRLDHLAYKYYRQPRKWWRICDANPDHYSPRALLGKDPVVVERFPLPTGGGLPPWSPLLVAIAALPGIEDVRIEEDRQIVRATEIVGGVPVAVDRDRVSARYIEVRYNSMTVDSAALAAALDAHGFDPGQAEQVGRVGKAIAVPPDAVG